MNKMLAALVAAFVFLACSSAKESMLSENGYITTPDGVRLFYQKVGNAEPKVLIPNGLYYFDDFKQLSNSHTLIFYDVRNRGSSDPVSDPSKLTNGIWQDVEDVETVRKHFRTSEMDLMGHSYIGLMIALYAMKYPQHVNRMVQISPAQPNAGKQYPAELAYVDSVILEVMGKLTKLQDGARPEDPVESCKQFWSVLGPINVFDPAQAKKIDWGRCELPNERNFMQYWSNHLAPTIQKVQLTPQNLSGMKNPVLILHGDKDRSAPYGGALDWARMWPDARLLTLHNVAHAPWIEAPDNVFQALRDFLNGKWPRKAERISTP